MGVHHYKLELIPRAAFGADLPASLSDAEIERGQDFTSGWWAALPPSSGLLAGLRGLLFIDKSWGETEEFVSSGEWTSSDIRIWKDQGRVWHITFRFSPVADDWALLERFISLARDEQCVLLEVDSGAVFGPDEQVIRNRLAASRAMQFVRDPSGTIVQAARDDRDDLG
jgi:hypothetical protein